MANGKSEENIGFHEDPRNGHGIIRSRTTNKLRSWEIPRTQQALETFNTEIGKVEFPGIYILFAKGDKVYIGEAKNLYNRLKQHMSQPEDKIKEWDRAYIINDGRPATQSDFNDTVVRKTLELYLINLFKANKYTVVAQGEPQQHSAYQKFLSDSLRTELNFFLHKKGVIHKLIESSGQEEIFGDELKIILEKKKKTITEWGKYEGIVDKNKVFIRPGSKKARGWQITFRGRKPGSFIDALQKGKGFLLIARGGAPLIPLTEVQKVIKEKTAYEQDTIDIYIKFGDGNVLLNYKDQTIDITSFCLR
jgi:hypothetical protein